MTILEQVKNLFGFTSAQPNAPIKSPEQTDSSIIAPKPLPAGPPPAAQRRDQILRFIVGKLRAYQNEPLTTPVTLQLSVVFASAEEEEVYRVALWASQPKKFQDELNRQLADNYINLPRNWQFTYSLLADELPTDCTYRDGNLGLTVIDQTKPAGAPIRAKLIALVGQTEQADYVLDPAQKTSFCIGRGHSTQTSSGRVRTNDIVFLNDDDAGFDPQRGVGNGAVSRSHATIRYDEAQQRYTLLVDQGGLPASGNKTKILHPDNSIERADISGMGYPLVDGDQVELGGEVTLLFEIMK
ncbi:FHA domain-containing protein [Spirosoma agri]|uniref:FHA domain-containing protein n=1 Tax=Spirosoma agri TaxID=1987381 RepID=A0A6M0IRM7_9BACT|nr:FHA domain-containing protein [Spirosoma agri]NEU70145.1 FHA domain-containing protein [Spirosoma agri]